MLGYVKYDLPNLCVKDFLLYKAMYCGLCKGISKSCGQRARMGLTYDVTFLSVLLHNILGVDIKIEKQGCVGHVKKRSIALTDELTEELGALNTILVYYKLTDDIADGGKGRGKRILFKKGFKRAKRKYPALVKLVGDYMTEQEKTEKSGATSPEMAADPSACMMQALSEYFLKEKSSTATRSLFYEFGKWVYLIDALDDYDKDKKKKEYNPFVLTYGCDSRKELMEQRGEEISFLFDTSFYAMRESLEQIPFSFNRDLSDNVILRGLPLETARVMRGEPPRIENVKL